MRLILLQLISLATLAGAFNPNTIRAFDDFLIKAIEEGDVPDLHSIPTIPPPPARPSSGSNTHSRIFNPWGTSNSTGANSTEESLASSRRAVEDDTGMLGSLLQQRFAQRSQHRSRRRLTKRSLDVSQASELRDSYQGVAYPQWPCCLLGNLAGDKGFLCVSRFYQSRLGRNVNRVHNGRLDFSSANTWKILQSFQRCVIDEQQAAEWQTCCEEAYEETRNRHNRWEQFRTALRNRDEL